MPSQNDIRYQQQLLQQHRATLRHFLRQRGALGQNFEPPGVAAGIAEARRGIAQCKAALRGWGVAVEDLPEDVEQDEEDEPPLLIRSAQPYAGPPQAPKGRAEPAGEQPPGPPTAWEKFRYNPLVFYSTMAFVILSALFACVASTISAGADLRGFWQQLGESGLVASPTALAEQPTPAPATQATAQLPTVVAVQPTFSPTMQATQLAAQPPTVAPVQLTPQPLSRTRITITITAITVKNIPAPDALDRLEPQGEGDIELNVHVGDQKLIWPAEDQPRHIRAGESAEVGLSFVVESDGAVVQIPIAMLEKDPEDFNENDVIMEETITVDPASLPAGPQVLADQAGDDAVITYTVTTELVP